MEVQIWAPPFVSGDCISDKLNEWMRQHPSKPPFERFLQDYISSAWPTMWHLTTSFDIVIDTQQRKASAVSNATPHEEICSICHNVLRSGTEQLNCQHTFHSMCLYQWRRHSETCPLCRRAIE